MGQLMFETEMDIHARSGRVALVRTKLVPARPARREEAEPAARSAERAAELRSRVADILGVDAGGGRLMDGQRGVEMQSTGARCSVARSRGRKL